MARPTAASVDLLSTGAVHTINSPLQARAQCNGAQRIHLGIPKVGPNRGCSYTIIWVKTRSLSPSQPLYPLQPEPRVDRPQPPEHSRGSLDRDNKAGINQAVRTSRLGPTVGQVPRRPASPRWLGRLGQYLLVTSTTGLGIWAGYRLGKNPAGRLLLYGLAYPIQRPLARGLFPPWYFGPPTQLPPCLLIGAIYGMLLGLGCCILLSPDKPQSRQHRRHQPA